MCGCGSIGQGAPSKTEVAAAEGGQTSDVVQQYMTNGQYFLPSQGGNMPTQSDVNDGRVRNAVLAEQTLERLRAATANINTPEKARAAGYHPNPSAPDHWINDAIFKSRDGFDLEHPATLMFEGNTLVGVMLSHDPRLGAPPDLGAGSWHTHGGTAGAEYASHVWFGKPLDKSFGKEVGDV